MDPISTDVSEDTALIPVSPSERNIQSPHEQECGLHLIWEPNYNDTKPEEQVEIIAIHPPGQGRSLQNWTSPKTDYCWLEEALPKYVPTARVFGFGYTEGPESAADSLLSELFQERLRSPKRSQNPIILISHGMGGIIAKKLFLITHPDLTKRDQLQEIHMCLKGFIFLGTDHYNWPSTRVLLEVMTSTSKQIRDVIPSFENHYANLEEFHNQAPRINHDFAFRGGETLPMACFFETQIARVFSLIKPLNKLVVPKDNARLLYPWVQNRPLKKSHFELGYFDENNKECTVLVELVQYIVTQIRDPTQSKAPGLQSKQATISRELMNRKPLNQTPNPRSPISGDLEVPEEDSPGACLLSLDGGGVRGIFAVVVLEAIMESVRQHENPEISDPPRPCDYFKIMGGTSTGGLLAIMLGRLRMDLVSCRAAYKALSTKIFKQSWARLPGQNYYDNWRGNPLYSGDTLREAIQEIVSERLTMKEKASLHERNIKPAEARMTSGEDPGCKTFVCAVREGKEDGCERLRTYDSSGGVACSCTIWEACRATSAAPTYFPSIKVNGHTYYDGGVISNNPIMEVYEEAKAEGLGNVITAVVSIGSGKPRHVNPGRTAYSTLSYAVKRMTGTEADHLAFSKRPESKDIYFRFNEEYELHKIDLADWRQVDWVEELALSYVEQPYVKGMIDQCARRLAKPRGKQVPEEEDE